MQARAIDVRERVHRFGARVAGHEPQSLAHGHDEVLDRGNAPLHLLERRGGTDAEQHVQVSLVLRAVHEQGPPATPGKRARELNGERRLSHPALATGDDDGLGAGGRVPHGPFAHQRAQAGGLVVHAPSSG